MTIKANNDGFLPRIALGRCGERNARSIRFDISDWIADYGKGSAQLIYQRPQDDAPYPVAIETSGGIVSWKVTLTDTERAGAGKCELRYYVGDTLVKSGTWPTYVWDAMVPTGEVPEEPGFSWFDQMMDAAARAVNASNHPPQISDRNTWLVWNVDTSSYVDSDVAAVGGVDVATAKIGQVIHVVDVDSSGRPTVWEAVDLASLSVAISTMESVLSGKSKLDGSYITDGYYSRTEYVTFYEASYFEDDGDIYYAPDCNLEPGRTYDISLNGEPLQTVLWKGEEGTQYTDANGNTYTLYSYTHVYTLDVQHPMPEYITVKGYKETVWPLDQKYLPEGLMDTINGKMSATDPVATGSFSMGRPLGSTVGPVSFAFGCQAVASGAYSCAIGNYVNATGKDSHAEGQQTTASGGQSHAEGLSTKATGSYSHAEGNNTNAAGTASHAEGYRTRTGNQTRYSANISSTANAYCHAEGYSTLASGTAGHAEGQCTIASGSGSHAEGQRATASGTASHAEGFSTTASGAYSHAEGYNTTASGSYSHVQGKFNVANSNYAHIVGNGSSDTARSNAHTLDWSGNAWYAGSLEASACILKSSTEGSAKRFKITINDEGVLTVVEI